MSRFEIPVKKQIKKSSKNPPYLEKIKEEYKDKLRKFEGEKEKLLDLFMNKFYTESSSDEEKSSDEERFSKRKRSSINFSPKILRVYEGKLEPKESTQEALEWFGRELASKNYKVTFKEYETKNKFTIDFYIS